MLAELSRVRATGIAVNNEELAYGLRSVAVPVLAATGEAVAAVNLAAHRTMASLDDLVARIGPLMQRTAAEISAQLGYRAARPGAAPPAAEADGGSRRADRTALRRWERLPSEEQEDRDHERAVIGLAKLPAVGQRAVEEAERRGADHRTEQGPHAAERHDDEDLHVDLGEAVGDRADEAEAVCVEPARQSDHGRADHCCVDPIPRDVDARQLGSDLIVAERLERPADVRELECAKDEQQADQQADEEVVPAESVVGEIRGGPLST